MKLFALQVLYKCDPKPKILKSAYELSSFGFFQRGSVQEFLEFTAKLVCERTETCSRSAVQERGLFESSLFRFFHTQFLLLLNNISLQIISVTYSSDMITFVVSSFLTRNTLNVLPKRCLLRYVYVIFSITYIFNVFYTFFIVKI